MNTFKVAYLQAKSDESKKCKVGDVLWFEEVTVIYPDGSGFKLPPFKIEIMALQIGK